MPFLYFLQPDDDDDDDYNDANLTPSDDNSMEIYSDDDNVEPVSIIYSNIFTHSRTFLNINI